MKRPEQLAQQKIVKWCRNNLDEDLVDFWHTNNNSRNKMMGAIMKSMGVKAGVLDLIFCWGRNWGFLDVKDEGEGFTAAQEEFSKRMKARGYPTGIVRSVDDMIAYANKWGLPRAAKEELGDIGF